MVIETMELKDVILSTLEELEHSKSESIDTVHSTQTQAKGFDTAQSTDAKVESVHNEALFLQNMRERIHVLFEGFQSPNNANIEAKVDLTLNFLEYLLSSIETRIKEIEK